VSRCARATVLAGVLAAVLPGPASGVEELRLPTPRDAVAIAVGAETIFFGPRGVETILPGAVADEERVEVGVGLDGSVRRVVVTQRLVLSGLGDFQFKIPGPAMSVEPLAESEAPPGLRRGSVLWQGFSPGEKVLAARMPLFADQEATRLPIDIDLAMSVDGRPLVPGEPVTGDLEIALRVRNVSPIPIGIASAGADPVELAPVLDDVYRALREGERPLPGEGGLPRSVALLGSPAFTPEPLEAPFRIRGSIELPGGSVEGLHAEGGVVRGSRVAFGALLGGGEPLELEVRVSGRARGIALPELVIEGEPAPPAPAMLRPPGRSWAAAASAGTASGPEMVEALLGVLWRSARLRQFDAYLGNPDPTGPAATAYRWVLDPPEAQVAPAPVDAAGSSAIGGLALVLLALLLALLLVVAWAHA